MGLLTGPTTLTGYGSLSLAGGTIYQIVEIDTELVSPGYHVSKFSPAPILKLAHLGWLALSVVGSLPPYTTNIDQVAWFSFLDFACQELFPATQPGGPYADTLWYSLEDSVINVAVYV